MSVWPLGSNVSMWCHRIRGSYRPGVWIGLVAILLLTLVATGESSAQPTSGEPAGQSREALRRTEGHRRWALLVGVNEYAEIDDLAFCGNDMVALRKQLIECGFPESQVFLLHDKAEENKYRPFKTNIERQLELVLGLAEPEDLVVVAFSGHGVHLDGVSYLCPTEARLSDPQGTMVAMDTVYRKLEESSASFKLLIVDACRNDPRQSGQRSMKPPHASNQFAGSFDRPPKGILVLTSCAPGQVSMEETQLGHGVFMNYVLSGLQGQADRTLGNADGRVSLLELYRYASRETKTYVARLFNQMQTPTLRGELTDDFDLSVAVIDPLAAGPSTLEPKPGTILTNRLGMKLAYVPRGECMMGCAQIPAGSVPGSNEAMDAPEIETPHRVRITRPYYIGVYEVTLDEFRKFVNDTGYQTDAQRDGRGGTGWNPNLPGLEEAPQYDWSNWGGRQSGTSPVVNVSWNDSMAFCDWLSRREGKTYRLPTEAEWEWACRAGSDALFYNGNDPRRLIKIANLLDASYQKYFTWSEETVLGDDGYSFTAPVGKFQPNALGLYDMLGNAWEWVSDWHQEGYFANSPVDNPTGPRWGSERIVRGGGWNGTWLGCRNASRYPVPADYRHPDTGFRVVLEP